MVVLICGDRNWSDKEMIHRYIQSYPQPIKTIIHGNCRGADKLAGAVAIELGIEILAFPANWGRFGRAAGPIRNRQMLDEGKPDLVVAFHGDLSKSKGTSNMLKLAKEAGIRTVVIGKIRG